MIAANRLKTFQQIIELQEDTTKFLIKLLYTIIKSINRIKD